MDGMVSIAASGIGALILRSQPYKAVRLLCGTLAVAHSPVNHTLDIVSIKHKGIKETQMKNFTFQWWLHGPELGANVESKSPKTDRKKEKPFFYEIHIAFYLPYVRDA